MLPVEPGTLTTYGDPVDTARALGLLDDLHVILVAPCFSITPWYADHPSNPLIRQESYFVDDLVPGVETLYPETEANLGPPRRLLLGFSKSGMGAMSLILRHSATFDAAAAWDGPLNQTQLSGLPEMTTVFGTQANFDLYAIPNALPTHAAEFQAASRLWLGGYSSQAAWRNDMTAAHNAMTARGMLHAWVDGPQRAHQWDSGWIADAIAFLDHAAPAIVFDAGTDAGPGDANAEASAWDGASDDREADGAGPDREVSDGVHDVGFDNGAAAEADSDVDARAHEAGDSGCGCSVADHRPNDRLAVIALAIGLAALRRSFRVGDRRSGWRRSRPR